MDVRKGIVVSNTNLIDVKKEAPFPWVGILLMIFLNITCYSGAFYLKYSTEKRIVELRNQIGEAKGVRDYKKIASVADVESRLTASRKIIDQRTNWGKFFLELENNTLPDIVFNSLEVQKQEQSAGSAAPTPGLEAPPVYIAEVRGTTVGIENLSKQIASFREVSKKDEKVFAKEVNIGKIDLKKTDSIEGDGGTEKSLDFSLRINVNPDILKTSIEKESTAGKSPQSGVQTESQSVSQPQNNPQPQSNPQSQNNPQPQGNNNTNSQ